MNYKAHVLIGGAICAAFVVATHFAFKWFSFGIFELIGLAILIFVSTLAPDLDHENGKLHQICIGLGLVLAIAGLIMYFLEQFNVLTYEIYNLPWIFVVTAGVLLAAAAFFGAQIAHHRGFMHSIPFCLIFGAVIFVVTSYNFAYASVAIIGCYSHMLCDGLPLKLH